MKKCVSRARNRLALILLFSFAFLLLVGFLLTNEVLMFVSVPLYIASVILMLSTNRCPHCGEYFRGLYWKKANAGYCRGCGELIEFDDCEK